jgi:drug/metabolite transporter (DMT)-like permease
LATLDHLNDSTFQQLNPHPLSEEKLLSRYWNYLQVHKIVKHTLAFTVIVMIAFFTFFICSYLGASTDTTLINTFFIFGTLAGVYIATFLVKREPPKTSESK